MAVLVLRLIAVLTALLAAPALASGEWPMLGHDVTRSGATADEVRPPFARKWYRAFPDEGINAGVQPIVAGEKVYVGTLGGLLHAIDARNGKDVWTYRAGGAILHACAADATRVYFGAADGAVYAVKSAVIGCQWRDVSQVAAPAVAEAANRLVGQGVQPTSGHVGLELTIPLAGVVLGQQLPEGPLFLRRAARRELHIIAILVY